MKSKASAEDLRALVHDLRPRSPQEVMGAAASSSLLSSTITATVTGIGMVFGVTILIFLFGGGPAEKKETAATVVAPSAGEPVAQTVATIEPTETTTAPSDATAEADPNSAVEAMGIGEAKDPDSQPESLENRLDKILDGLE